MKNNKVMLFTRANNNIGVEKQRVYLTIFCISNGYEIVSECNIKGSWKTAPADLFNECEKQKGQIDKVIFTSWDRLSPSVESSNTCKKAFRNLGVELECVSDMPLTIRRKCLTRNVVD